MRSTTGMRGDGPEAGVAPTRFTKSGLRGSDERTSISASVAEGEPEEAEDKEGSLAAASEDPVLLAPRLYFFIFLSVRTLAASQGPHLEFGDRLPRKEEFAARNLRREGEAKRWRAGVEEGMSVSCSPLFPASTTRDCASN
ncbi:hypothetical protein C4D60_Mb07t08420 [Musa balbisiana]|uniref:Uncharacterized protein n=1 Tax=Musa balbisiana TaxID=52838 RepID=A0A4S8JF09_MUSBA|nr:hypothetical protein C4D60_Mb07t08420 [Musa balbisiana]